MPRLMRTAAYQQALVGFPVLLVIALVTVGRADAQPALGFC